MKTTLRILKALSDRNRLRIVEMLQRKQEACVCEICEVLGVSQSTTSRHLRILEDAGVIYSTRDGKWINYRLNYNLENEKIDEIIPLIHKWLKDDRGILVDSDKLANTNRSDLCQS